MLVGWVVAGAAWAEVGGDYPKDPQQAIDRCAGAAGLRVRAAELAPGIPLLIVGAEALAELRTPAASPAVLVVASRSDRLAEVEIARQIAESIARRAADDPQVAQLLDQVTFYVLPIVSPAALANSFAAPRSERPSNNRPWDDDRDGAIDEDPPEDLNGDGVISQMRVEDPAGEYLPHPREPRLMRRASKKRGEVGRYRLLTEGIDNDGDGAWNEDGPGGVELNRNFPFEYPYFQPGAGPHQVSEPECRALADFVYAHPNIFLIYTLGPQGNLVKPWKHLPADGPIVRNPPSEDADWYALRHKEFAKAFDLVEAPKPSTLDGAFAPWAYYHFGRWSLATPGWWPGCVNQTPSDGENEKQPDIEPESSDDPPKKKENKSGDDGADQAPKLPVAFRTARWLQEQGTQAIAPWIELDYASASKGAPAFGNAELAGKKVELGGLLPYADIIPPAEQLPVAAGAHADFLLQVVELRPRLQLVDVRAVPLGAGVYRVEARLVNTGQTATLPQMGQTAQQHQRLQIELQGVQAPHLLAGPLRQSAARLAPGEQSQHSWLVQLADPTATPKFTVSWNEPSLGKGESIAEVASTPPPATDREANQP